MRPTPPWVPTLTSRLPDSALQEKIEPGLLLVGEADLGDQHLDEHRGHGPVELLEDAPDLRPLAARAAEEDEVPARVDDDAGPPEGRGRGPRAALAPFAAARTRFGGLGGRGRGCGRGHLDPDHPLEDLGQLLGLGVPDLVGEDRLLDRLLLAGVEDLRPFLDVVDDVPVRGEGDHLVHPPRGG